MAIHGSALLLLLYPSSSATSFLSRYWYSLLVLLHSIASFLFIFAAIMSGAGYFMLPLPATLHAVQSGVFQNMCIISLSAFVPFFFWLMYSAMFLDIIYFAVLLKCFFRFF